MPLEGRDATRLEDILHYGKLARQIMTERTIEEFVADEMAKLAVVRRVEVIGEAGHQVSPATQAAMPTIPWHLNGACAIASFQDYGNTDFHIVHRVVRDELPGLLAAIEAFLSQSYGIHDSPGGQPCIRER